MRTSWLLGPVAPAVSVTVLYPGVIYASEAGRHGRDARGPERYILIWLKFGKRNNGRNGGRDGWADEGTVSQRGCVPAF